MGGRRFEGRKLTGTKQGLLELGMSESPPSMVLPDGFGSMTAERARLRTVTEKAIDLDDGGELGGDNSQTGKQLAV